MEDTVLDRERLACPLLAYLHDTFVPAALAKADILDKVLARGNSVAFLAVVGMAFGSQWKSWLL